MGVRLPDWVYAYLMLFNYKSLYEQTQSANRPNSIGRFNRFRHYTRLFTPKDTTVVTPNTDTPYSWVWLDLRAEPIALSVPDVPAGRYYVIQGVDLFTYNFAYVGSRATGNKAGGYLFAGPDWTGAAPDGIDKVFRAETRFVLLLMRVQLKSPADIWRTSGPCKRGSSSSRSRHSPPAHLLLPPRRSTGRGGTRRRRPLSSSSVT